MKHKRLTATGIFAAILCIFSPFSFPMGAIPVSFATLAVYLISSLSDYKLSVSSVLVYILLGVAGLPVFSGFTGGFQQLAGLTGGFIIGYLPCAFIISFLTNKFKSKKIIFPLSMIAGTVACYLIGTAWYGFHSKTDFISSLAVCILPFLLSDTIKIAIASIAGFTLRKRLSKYI